jgi:hypothetical protein
MAAQSWTDGFDPATGNGIAFRDESSGQWTKKKRRPRPARPSSISWGGWDLR